MLDRVFLPHSLGSFYTMICEFIGYKKYGDEGKVMGLAPYGKDTYVDEIRKILALKNGSFQLNMSYFKPLGADQGMQVLPDGTVRLARHFSSQDGEAVRCAPRAVHRNHATRHGSRLCHAALLRGGVLSSAEPAAPARAGGESRPGRRLRAQ